MQGVAMNTESDMSHVVQTRQVTVTVNRSGEGVDRDREGVNHRGL